jgi:acetylornithine deacetylase
MDGREALSLLQRSFDANRLLEHLTALTRVPSPQTALFESEPQVQTFIRDYVRPRVERLGIGQGHVDAMGNYLWRAGGAAAGGVLFAGYAMTHPAGSMPDPFSAKVVDGRPHGIEGPCLWGRGVCEQKGPLAAMLEALEIVRATGRALRGRLAFAVSTAGETGRHESIARILKGYDAPPDMAVVGIGTANRLCLANKGRIDVQITVRGKSSHSSMPWDGRDAIEGMRQVMDRLDALPLSGEHPHLGRPTLTRTRIGSGPEATHTVQDRCDLTLDRRLLPGDDPDAAFQQVGEAVRDIQGYGVAVTRGAYRYPAALAEDSRLARAIQAASRAVRGREAETFYSHAALDAGYLARSGIEATMWGPGDLRFAHTDAEVVSLQEVGDAAKMYAYLMLTEAA